MDKHDISKEIWREYEWVLDTGGIRTYRIESPVWLYMRSGGTTHRIVDVLDIVHCVPAPGKMGCVLRWAPKDITDPVQF